MSRNPIITNYDAETTNEQLKVMRHLLISARRILWDMDEGKSTDPTYQMRSFEEGGMHPEVRRFQDCLDECVRLTARMQT